MKRSLLLILVLLGALSCSRQVEKITRATAESGKLHELVITSDDFHLDRMYESMEGPVENLAGFRLHEAETAEVLWLKSIRVEAEALDGGPASNEFFCHANLKFDGPAPVHNNRFENRRHMPKRLLTLAEGSTRIEFPQGFGIPIHSDTELGLDLTTHQLNHESGDVEKLRFRTVVSYLTEPLENGKPLRALFRRTVYIYDKSLGSLPATTEDEFCGDISWTDLDEAGLSLLKNNPIHWLVPPGEHTYELNINEQLFLTFDTTIHYAVGHFHTYCEWLRLIDNKTGEVMVELKGEQYAGKRGVASISKFQSPEGVSLPKDADLSLQVKYNNPTEKPIDAMAILYLYMAEPD